MTDETNDETESLAESIYVKALLAAMWPAALGVVVGFEAAAAGVSKLHGVTLVVLLLFAFYGVAEAISAIHELRS